MKIVRPIEVDDAALASSSVTEDDYAAYDSGTTYALGDHVINIDTDVHEVYESLAGSNMGNALTDTTKWLKIGATNRWKMFDGVVGAQTTNADSIVVTLNASGRVDTVVLLNVSAGSARVRMIDGVEGVVYDETKSLISDSGIADWYAYFFEPIERDSDVVFSGMPPYSDAQIEITLSDPGATVKCGECIVGFSKDIGDTAYGAQIGIQDYSVKSADEFGNFTITERAYASRGVFSVLVDAGYVNALKRLLAERRATPTVYIGSDDYTASVIYGFFRDFTEEISYPSKSIFSIEVEGLT